MSDWPRTEIWAPRAEKRLTIAPVANFTSTGSAVLPGMSRLSSIALPVVLTATVTVPPIVTLLMPTRLSVPWATSA